jgi:hypothetical protein
MTTKTQRKSLADAQWGEINAAVTELNNDLRFRRFMEGIAGLKDVAVLDAASDETLKFPAVTAAALGRVRAYQDIIDFVGERSPLPDEPVE